MAGALGGLLRGNSEEAIQAGASTGNDVGMALAGVSVKVLDGEDYLMSARPCVFVFNHQSKLDLPVLVHLIRSHATGVAKKEVKQVPLLGPILDAAGLVFIDRGRRHKAIEQQEPAVRKLRETARAWWSRPREPVRPHHVWGSSRRSVPHRDAGAGAGGTDRAAQQRRIDVARRPTHQTRHRRGAGAAAGGHVVVDGRDDGEHADEVRQMFVKALADWPVEAFDDGRLTRTSGCSMSDQASAGPYSQLSEYDRPLNFGCRRPDEPDGHAALAW